MEDLLLTWNMAGYIETSLKALALAPLPTGLPDAAVLRRRLIQALTALCSRGTAIPVSVQVDRLLDRTVDYFMSEYPEHFCYDPNSQGQGQQGKGNHLPMEQQHHHQQQQTAPFSQNFTMPAGAFSASHYPSVITYPNIQSMAERGSIHMPAPPLISTGPRLSQNLLPPPVAAMVPPPSPLMRPPHPLSSSFHVHHQPQPQTPMLGVPYPMKPLFPSVAVPPVQVAPPIQAPIFGKPLESAANILPGGLKPLSFSVGGPSAPAPAIPTPGEDSELAARAESMQPLYEYLRAKMTAIMKQYNYTDAHIDVSKS